MRQPSCRFSTCSGKSRHRSASNPNAANRSAALLPLASIYMSGCKTKDNTAAFDGNIQQIAYNTIS